MNIDKIGAERSPVTKQLIKSAKMKKKNIKTKYKKAPQAPRRFKSAYMFFSTTKHKDIREELGGRGIVEKTTNIAKLVSQAWKELTPEVKELWEEMARQDKARFEVEKSLYTGPWKVPAKKRSQKDPNAPKRPMSAFLAYSHAKRAEVKKKSPTMNNAEISRVLAQLWKEAPEEEKKDHIDKEYQLRQKYLSEIAVWRENTEKEFNEQRKHREDIAMKTVVARSRASSMNEDGRDPSASQRLGSHEKDGGTREQGTGNYAGYYHPSHHFYNHGAAQGSYSQDYRPPYSSSYYHNASSQQQPPQEQYEQPPRTGAEPSQDGYSDYYPPSAYGYYPPPGSTPYPPGHEQYAPNGFGGGYADYPPQHKQNGAYGSYYDHQPYPPPHDEQVYDRDQYAHEPPPPGYHPPYGDNSNGGDAKPAASANEPTSGEADRKP